MKLIPLIAEGLPISFTPVGRLALRIHDRALGDGKRNIPAPAEIFTLLIQSLHMLFSCYPTAEQATKYVVSQRFFRVRRIGKELRRQFRTIYPQYDEEVIELVVRSILHYCQFCNVIEMRGYLATVQGFQDF